MRVKYPVTDNLLRTLNARFSDICLNGGQFQRSGALPEEENEPELKDLHRIVFPFNRTNFGRLRSLIDVSQSALPLGRWLARRLRRSTALLQAFPVGRDHFALVTARFAGNEPAIVDATQFARWNAENEQCGDPPVHQCGSHHPIGVPTPPAGDQPGRMKVSRPARRSRRANAMSSMIGDLGEPAQRFEDLTPDKDALITERHMQPPRPPAGHPGHELAKATA